MMNTLKALARATRYFCREESGGGTIEFVIVFPAAMYFFTASFELGQMGIRNVMLEHAVDRTVRQVRIGTIAAPEHDKLKETICDTALIIPDCLNQVKLEMVRNDPRAWKPLDPNADCVDRSEEGAPVINFTPGDSNDLMVLRACALFDPILPTTPIGLAISQKDGGTYALVATSSFVVEPFK